MKPRKKGINRRVVLALILLPLLIAGLVVGGLFFGLYLSEVTGTRGSVVPPLAFSFLGFIASLYASYQISKRVSRRGEEE